MSVCAWIKELEPLPYNSIVVFKPQGKPQPENMDNVGKDDFLLGIQTQFQRDMLVKYGHLHGFNTWYIQICTTLKCVYFQYSYKIKKLFYAV